VKIGRLPLTIIVCAGLTTAFSAVPASGAESPNCLGDGNPDHLLTSAQQHDVNRSLTVVATMDVPGGQWPRVCVYRFVAANPEASLAVFVDYPLRASYIPDVRRSAVVPGTADSVAKRVAYVIHVILRVDETDTLREVVRSLDPPLAGGYQLAWTALTSSMAKSVNGSATFLPWHNDFTSSSGTLMIYDQTVEPGSRLAGLPFIKRRGIDAVRNATVAIAKQIENEVAAQPAQLARQVSELRRTLDRIH
jgi:hypothetical protein